MIDEAIKETEEIEVLTEYEKKVKEEALKNLKYLKQIKQRGKE